MQKAIIIHGTMGSPDSNWFPWLAGELARRKIITAVPRMPTPEGQSLDSWMAALGSLSPDGTILAGHSIGVAFLLRVLERAERAAAACLFVAGFTGPVGIAEYDVLNESFLAGSFDWDRIRRSCGRAFCYAGANDPYVSLSQGRVLAERLAVPLRIIPGGGHLNAESGYTSFPELLDDLEEHGIVNAPPGGASRRAER